MGGTAANDLLERGAGFVLGGPGGGACGVRTALCSAVIAIASGCSLDTGGIGTTPTDAGDTDADTDTDTDVDADTDVDTDTDTDTDGDGDRDGDGLRDEHDPCLSVPNTLLAEGTHGFSVLQGEWSFDGTGATVTGADFAYSWNGPCPDPTCVTSYVVDVVVDLREPLPTAFGILGSMAWPGPEDFHCGILPGEEWETVLATEPGAPGEPQPIEEPTDPFSLRLIVAGGRQWCRGQRVEDPVLATRFAARPAGAVGLYSFGGPLRFERVRVWDLPDGCVVVPTVPPPP